MRSSGFSENINARPKFHDKETTIMKNEQNHENENKTVAAFCDCCDAQATADRDALIANGWFLGTREQFCPAHND